MNKNCIWPLMTCIAASRTLRSSCGICWRAFTRMWIRWQVNLSMSPSRMRISASMNASFLWIFHEFSWIYLNMFMDFLFKVLCLTCLMNQLTKHLKHLLHVHVHVYIYFCGFSQSIIYIFNTYTVCTCQYWKCDIMMSVFLTTTVLSEVYIVLFAVIRTRPKNIGESISPMTTVTLLVSISLLLVHDLHNKRDF